MWFDLSKQIGSIILEILKTKKNEFWHFIFLHVPHYGSLCHFDDESTILPASAYCLYLELWFSFKSRNYCMHVDAFLKLSTYDYDFIKVKEQNERKQSKPLKYQNTCTPANIGYCMDKQENVGWGNNYLLGGKKVYNAFMSTELPFFIT